MGIAFLAFFDLGSAGLSSTGTCLGTYSGVAFLSDEALLVEGFTFRVSTGTCMGTCLVGAFPLTLTEVSSGAETSSSTWSGSCSEGLVGLGVFGGSLGRFFGRFGGGF